MRELQNGTRDAYLLINRLRAAADKQLMEMLKGKKGKK